MTTVNILTYPGECDPMQEMVDWNHHGFEVTIAHGDSDKVILEVIGDIPENVKKVLQSVGVQIDSFEKA